MKKIKAIFTIIRLPNLVFIFLTQILTYYFIIRPTITEHTLTTFQFLLFAFSTVLIATAGYIINDYFDIGIDAINKPEKVTIEKIFKRRTIIIWHIILNIIAIIIVAYLTFYFIKLRLVAFQILSIFLLLIYSTTFKRKLIIGNVSIAILTSLTLITSAVYEPHFDLFNPNQEHAKLLWIFILFAFLITLIREIVKDIEDIKGDVAQHCETIPLVWGISIAKKIIYVLLTTLLIFLLIVGMQFFKSNTILVLYFFILVFTPLLFIVLKIKTAQTSQEFHLIATYLKWITLAGIVSMILL